MRRCQLLGTLVMSLWLKRFVECLTDVTSLRLSKSLCSRSVLVKHTNYFRSVFPSHLGRRIYETKFPTHVRIYFFIFLFVI